MGVPEINGIDEGSTVLLLAPCRSDADEDTCLELLTPTEPDRLDVLSVAFTRSVDELADIWERHVGQPPASAAVVTLDMLYPRSDGVASGETPFLNSDGLAVETVSEPSNLTRLGVHISEYLSTWADEDTATTLCFQSLTVLLQYADLDQVSQFLHVVSGQIASHDALAHFHVDPAAHEEETIRTLEQFCDVTVDRSTDGDRR